MVCVCLFLVIAIFRLEGRAARRLSTKKTSTRQVYVFVICSMNFLCGLLLALPLGWTFLFLPYGMSLFVCGRQDFPFTLQGCAGNSLDKVSYHGHYIR